MKHIKLLYFLLFSSCSVNIGTYTADDLEDQNQVFTAIEQPTHQTIESGQSAPATLIVYSNNITDNWGFETSECKDFKESYDVKFQGISSLELEWNSQYCPWVGWGKTLKSGEPLDFSEIIRKTALEFYVRSKNGEGIFPEMMVGLEDENKKNNYVKIDLKYFEGTKLTSSWQKVLIPLDEFQLKSKGVDVGTIVQIIFSFQGKGSLYMDDIRFVPFSGNSNNPFNKSRDQIYIDLPAESVELPFTIFDNDLNSNWGVEYKANKEIVVQDDIAKDGEAIRWKWDYTKSNDWVGWGTALKGNYELIDINGKIDQTAIEFFIRLAKGEKIELPVMVGLEDVYAKSTYLNLDVRYIESDKFSENWEKVIIPLKDFSLESKGLKIKNLKQLILYADMFSPNNKGDLIIDEIKIVPYKGRPGNPFNKERYNVYIDEKDILSENRPTIEGVFVGGFLTNNPSGTGKSFGQLIGRKPASVMWYSDWFTELNFQEIQSIIDEGYMPHIVWEAMRMETRDGITLQDIIDGKWDAYITKSAQGIKSLNGVIQLRLFHEFNGDWYPWCVAVNDKNPQKYIDAWRHVVDIFKKEEVKNVQWVWCFNKLVGVPNKDADWNQPHKAYPGDEYVDWVSVDFYNYFPVYDENWHSFMDHFTPDYLYMAERWPNKPIQIGEFASNKTGGDKAQWFLDMNEAIKKYFPRLKNYNYFEINKEADWRLAATPESQKAFQKIMKDEYNRSSATGLINVPLEYKFEGMDDIMLLKEYQSKKKEEMRESLKKYIDTKKVAEVTYQSGNLVVDGNIGKQEWEGKFLTIVNSKFYIKYDDRFLYIAGEVEDNTPLINNNEDGNIWNGDVVEIGISTNSKEDILRDRYFDSDFHLGIKGSDNSYVYNWNSGSRMSDAEVVMKKNSKGYQFEAKIPLKDLKNASFQKGELYGFELALSDGDKTGRKIQRFWNSAEEGFHQHPYLWGYFKAQ